MSSMSSDSDADTETDADWTVRDTDLRLRSASSSELDADLEGTSSPSADICGQEGEVEVDVDAGVIVSVSLSFKLSTVCVSLTVVRQCIPPAASLHICILSCLPANLPVLLWQMLPQPLIPIFISSLLHHFLSCFLAAGETSAQGVLNRHRIRYNR